MVGNRFINPTVAAPRDPNQKLGFQDIEKEVVATRSVKLKNKAAEQAAEEKRQREEYKRKFDERADQTMQYHAQQGDKAIETISRFMKMAEDKTLARNKGGIANNVEIEIRQELIQLALDMNNDEAEEDNGKGSVVVLSVLTKIVLLQRDRINELEYEIQQLKKDLLRKEASSPTTRQP